jgi:cytochrome c biogenesis protein CcmG/thiol:disulfide interchange protein DsbE
MSKSNLAKLILVALVVLGAVLFALRQRDPRPVSVSDAAPDFRLASLESGPVALSDYRGKVVLVNFWATWCPPCVEETPGLEKFAEQMRDQDVTVIGVSVDEDLSALRKFVAQYHLSYPIALDPDRVTANRYGTFKFPETYILDRDGRVAEKIIGATDWQDPRMVSFVQSLVQGNSQSSR